MRKMDWKTEGGRGTGSPPWASKRSDEAHNSTLTAFSHSITMQQLRSKRRVSKKFYGIVSLLYGAGRRMHSGFALGPHPGGRESRT